MIYTRISQLKGKARMKSKKPLNKKEKVLKKSTRRPAKKKLLQPGLDVAGVIAELYGYLENNPDIYLAFQNEHFAVLVKKKILNVNHVINAHAMQPFERNEERVIFDTFILEWGDVKSKLEAFGPLVEMGVMVSRASRPEGVLFLLDEA